MNKLLSFAAVCTVASVTMTGCGTKYPELPDDAAAFKMGTYTDKNDDNAQYGSIEYNGRTYLPYGTISRSLNESDIDKCIGYVVQDGTSSSVSDPNNKDTRLYTLTADKDNNFLMEYYIADSEMNQPYFWRASDTNGKDINIPSYIDCLDNNIWK